MAVKEIDFTKGKILPSLLRFSVPCIVMNLIQSLFLLTDLFIVGHWAPAKESIASIAIAASPLWLHTIFLMGLGGGINVLIGRAYGAKDTKKLNDVAGTAMTLLTAFGLFFSVESFIFAEDFLRILRTPPEIMPLATAYLQISALGFLPIACFHLLGSILRGIGNSTMPLLYMSVGLFINVTLDIFFIAYEGMGSNGAALATVLSQIIGCAFALLYLRIKRFPFVFRVRDFRFCKETAKNIISLALPISMQDIFVEASFVVILVIVNMLGTNASAGYGIVVRMWGFTALPAYSFGISLSAVASQNIGAIRLKRAKETLYWCFLLSVVPCWIFVALIQWFPKQVVSIFTNDVEIMYETVQFLYSSSWEIAVLPFDFCLSCFLVACGKPTFTMLTNIFGHFVIKLPLAYILVFVMGGGMYALGWTFLSSTLVVTTIYFAYFKSGRWMKIKKL